MDNITLIKRMQQAMQDNGLNEATRKAYLFWSLHFIDYKKEKQIEITELNQRDINKFILHLKTSLPNLDIVENQVLQALVFMFREITDSVPNWLDQMASKKTFSGSHSILSPDECRRVLSYLFGQDWLIVALIYGAGLRLSECVRLRARDIDFERHVIWISNPTSSERRPTILPARATNALRVHLDDLKKQHFKDIADGYGYVYIPERIKPEQKNAHRSWQWQYVFPSGRRISDPKVQTKPYRYHLDDTQIKNAVESAASDSGIFKHVSVATLRNSFAVHALQQGIEVKLVEALLGHGDSSKMPQETLLQRAAKVTSPLDRLMH